MLVQALVLLVVLRTALWGLRFATVRALLEHGSRWRPTRTAPPDVVIWAVQAAARRMRGTSCLAQGLAIRFLLARHGHPAVLRIGVAHDERGMLRAHAWVESGALTTDCGTADLERLAAGSIAELRL